MRLFPQFYRFGMAMILILSSLTAYATPYPKHDIQKIITLLNQDGATVMSIDYQKLDKFMADMAKHADNYPAQFDSAKDKAQAILEMNQLTFVLKKLNYADNDPKLLKRSAYILQLAHNLDIPNAYDEANRLYKKLFTMYPQDSLISFQYGVFFMNAGEPEKAEFYLKRAIAGKYYLAEFSLGMAQLMQQKQKEAIASFQRYLKKYPNDAKAKALLQQVQAGNFRIEEKTVETGK